MKKLLKFKKALGYYNDADETLIIELEDGRYGHIFTAREKAPNNTLKGCVGEFRESFIRGREIMENIPQDWIEKAKNILNDTNSKIRG